MNPLRKITSVGARGALRLERHPMVLGLAVLAVTAFIAYLSVIAINGVPFQDRYPVSAVVPADAPLLKDGDEVRIGGQRAGQVKAVELHPDGALVKMELTKGPVGRDARATVRLRGLAGAVYVQIDRGDTSRALPPDSTIERERTASAVELADVVDTFDPATRAGLGRTLAGYGGGLIGTGRDLNETVADLGPALSGITPLVDAFTPRPGEFSGFLRAARRTAGAAAPRGSRDLERLVPSAARTFGALGARRAELGAFLDRLRPFEDQALRTLPVADPVLADLAAAARDLAPGVRELARTTPALSSLLASGDRFADLSRLARAAHPVLSDAGPLMRELQPGAGSLAPLVEPLAPLTGSFVPYRAEFIGAPEGFTEWGRFFYDANAGNATDGVPHRGVRFGPVFTCHPGRVLYPEPGTATGQRQPCP